MRVIIVGSRDFTNQGAVDAAIKESGFQITEVVCGGAAGVDWCGWMWADKNNIPKIMFKADWKRHGKAAGPIRNGQMADYAEALIAVHHAKNSPGTKNMIDQANKKGLRVFVKVVA